MPQQFTGSVDAPKDIQFGADEFVDASNSLEGLEEAAKAFETATSTLVKKSLTDDILAEDALNQSRYEEIRRTKKAYIDAASSRDEEGVARFGKQLEELTIAENQGAINGTNSSIRKESLLRSYINRFPHREEQIRQLYSHTRAQLQESRASKVSDPVEDGINDVIAESVKRDKSPIAVLEDRQHEDFMNRAARDATYNAALGVEIAPQLTEAFDKHAVPIFYSQATDYISLAMNMAQQGQGDIDHMTVKRNLEMMKIAARARVSSTVNNILAASREPGATLPPGFLDAQVAKVDAMFDGMIKYSDNVDTLKEYGRFLEHRKNKRTSELREVDGMFRMLVDIGEVDWAAKYLAEDYPQIAAVAFTQGKAGVQALIDNAPTGMEKNRLKLQYQMLNNYDPEQQAEDLRNIVETGAPPTPTGDPFVDATRLTAHTDSLIKSSNTPQEIKDKAGVAISEAEKSDPNYIGPGAHWYKKPERLQLLRKSETLKTRLREELVGTQAKVTRLISESPQLSQNLQFVVDIEKDQKQHKTPWKAYPTGGPFSIGTNDNPANVDFEKVAQIPVIGLMVADDKYVLDALNNAYWTIRAIDGPSVAEEWAEQILAQVAADQEQQAAADAEAKAAEDAPFDIPTYELTD